MTWCWKEKDRYSSLRKELGGVTLAAGGMCCLYNCLLQKKCWALLLPFLLVIAKFLFRSHLVINIVLSHKRRGSKGNFWIEGIPVFPLCSFLGTASSQILPCQLFFGLSFLYLSIYASDIFHLFRLSAVFLSSIYTAFPLFLFLFSSQLLLLPCFKKLSLKCSRKRKPCSV